MRKQFTHLQQSKRGDELYISLFKRNRKNIAKQIKNGLVILYSGVNKRVSSQESYDFRPNKMFYYVTGLSDPNLVVILKVDNNEVESCLFIPEPDPLKEKWEGKQLSEAAATYVSNIQSVFYKEDLIATWKKIRRENKDLPMWLNLKDYQDIDFRDYFDLPVEPKEPRCIHDLMAELRVIKTKEEIDKLQKATELAAKGVEEVISNAKPGMYEYQLEAIHDFAMKSHGLKPGQYKTIVAAGKNATILHYLDNDCLVGDDDLILMDLDVEVDAYHCDFTRVFPANGMFSIRQKEVYSAVLDVQKRLINRVKPGITYGKLNELAKQWLTEACEALRLFDDGQELEDYYFHNVGHFIGLDTHDVGQLDEATVLEAGMVLTIEPGLYIPEEQIGVRIEDMIAVTTDSYINLTEHMVKEINEIEQLMKEKEYE